ncbi:ras guanine nucleotide exchange factor R isoform X2 [Ceratina calcarata]|uniref:Ras guanine nucleotide exchange factor R isoform X2 n=1 Tax=Ceratina calcarata TaxID=156304 RepID=A0AAJ7S105_9HYME|nr:ras guanine nucleotide exchange factor R isoform X2 [Ceratina calcarata]
MRGVLCFLWIATILRIEGFVAAETDSILPGTDLSQFQQSHDPRPRLSASQQAQILSDVQQHQQRYRRPQDVSHAQRASFSNLEAGTKPQNSASYSSLAKYKVDRAKQQQLQQLLQQQQQVQQLLQEQQQKIAQQLSSPNYQTQYQPKQQQQFQYNNQYQNANSQFQNLQQDLSQPLFSDRQTLQLQEYLQKQRELELLQKQRQQLLLEQQELRRQQEHLRLQQLQKLTSTTPLPIPVTSPSTIAVSTTVSPLLVSLPTARKITPSETELFLKAIATHQKKFSSTTPIPPTTSAKTTTTSRPPVITPVSTRATSGIPDNLLTLIQEQENEFVQQGKPKPQIKVIYQTEKPVTSKSVTTTKARSSSLGSERDILLKQLKLALAQSIDDDVRNISTRDIILPNGKKIQLIDSSSSLTSNLPTDGSTLTTSTLALTTSTTIKPPKAILEELTKGVLPPGADFEVIRQKSDGKLEEVGKVPIQSLPAKKVTFVVLEEQPDGSYKVQGVKGNAEKEGGDVESIVEKIKKGELKLPPKSSSSTTVPSLQNFPSSLNPNAVSARGVGSTTARPTTVRSTSASSRYNDKPTDYYPHVTISPNSVSTTDKYLSSASSVTSHVFNSVATTPKSSSFNQDNNRTKHPSATRGHFIPTMAPVNEIITTTSGSVPTTFSHQTSNSYVHFSIRPTDETHKTTARPSTTLRNENIIYQDETTLQPVTELPSTRSLSHESLGTLLRREGLYAMSKYLRQSGLDNVLNETGPYTIFVPTDKAFRTLLVQLGGPEKAEQKFRDNPRLLSGLLLHHVIPGAFRIDSLQDEMTGISLAGTQLRVNEYAMHDHEWNDVKVTTINGARVASNKRDIEIPQGVAHAVDRVMFPLPVGDLVQTMQADRERRFTTFLKMLFASGLQDSLSGPKTFTVFAPTDSAFEAAAKDGAPVWTEDDGAEAAKTIISKHIIPSTLYTAGMRYYLQKDTLRPQSPVHVHKNGGRVRVNEAYVVTHNVPATNGVLHAIDGVL